MALQIMGERCLSSWAVSLADDHTMSAAVVDKGVVPGAQNNYRAELYGWTCRRSIAAIHFVHMAGKTSSGVDSCAC